jgi:hypothetical protein
LTLFHDSVIKWLYHTPFENVFGKFLVKLLEKVVVLWALNVLHNINHEFAINCENILTLVGDDLILLEPVENSVHGIEPLLGFHTIFKSGFLQDL